MRRISFIPCIFLLIAVQPVFSQVSDDTLYREAQRRYQSGDFELADSLFNRYLQEYPAGRRAAEASFHQAIIDYKLGSYRQALEKIDSFMDRYPGYEPREIVLFWRGCILYQVDDYERAAADLGVFLLTAENGQYRQKALLFKGLSEAKLKNTGKAIEYLRRAVAVLTEDKEKAYAAVYLLSLLASREEYETILRLLEEDLRDIRFEDYKGYRELYTAEAMWHLGRTEDAAKIYKAMVKEQLPGDIAVVPFKRLFSLYQERNEQTEMQILIDEAEVKLSGKPAILSEFWSVVGVTSFQSGKYDLAESYLSRAWRMRRTARVSDVVPVYLAELNRRRQDIGKASEILETYFNEGGKETVLSLAKLGSIYQQTERWEDASKAFQKITVTFPDTEKLGEYVYYLAYSLYRQQRFDEAADEIKEVLEKRRGGSYAPKLFRLQSIIEKEQGDYDAAISSLRQYVPVNPEDYSARYDLMQLYYRQGKYETVIAEVEQFYEENPDFELQEPKLHVLFRYLHGLSCIPGKEYGRAAGILEGIREKAARDVSEIEPYVLFYIGWARYRNGEYGPALSTYRTFFNAYPDHPLTERAYYTAGWCAYTDEKYAEAVELFQLFFNENLDTPLRGKGVLMFGKSAVHSKQYEDAAFAFHYLVDNFPDSDLADDAQFEYAEVLRLEDKLDQSIEAYKEVFTKYPRSSLAEEAMYKRGELLYRQGRYIEARNAFYEYRNSFPEGTLMDAALYWGGMAFKFSDEPFGAVLLWERLIDSYPESSFRPDALAETAVIYMESGNLQEALDLYNRLIHQYPVEAKSVRAEVQREKIRNMVRGMTGKEAELSAVIAQEGVDTRAGREAALEVSKLYIYRGRREEDELKRAKLMLEMLLERRAEDPQSAARAKYLLGEYYFRMGEMRQAANAFIEAATMYPRDRDFMASALYKAAEITKRTGNLADTRALVDRMQKNFPDSQWSLEAKKLLEGAR